MKNKINIRLFYLTLCIAIILSGCKVNKSPVESKVRPTITWAIVKYNQYIPNINENSEVMRFIEEKFKCNIHFKYYNSFNIKTAAMLKDSENAPDILTVEALTPEINTLITDNLVYPANEIIPQYKNFLPFNAEKFLAENRGTLYGIPGVFPSYETATMPTEGIYVNEYYYNRLGNPPIENTEQILGLLNNFIKLYRSENSNIPISLVLGDSGNGIETLKHLFGIYPVIETDGIAKLGLASARWKNLLDYLCKLSNITTRSMALTGDVLNSCLENESVMYIGPINCIENFNSASLKHKYISIKSNFTSGLFKTGSYGSCQSYVFKKTEVFPQIKELIQFLLSDEGNNLVKFGLENKHWIYSENDIVQMDWVKKRIEQVPDYINTIGIGQLMFFSKFDDKNSTLFDRFFSLKNPYYKKIIQDGMSSSNTEKIKKIEQLQQNLCQKAVSLDADKILNKHEILFSELNYFPIYEEQYRIENLQTKYDIWKTYLKN